MKTLTVLALALTMWGCGVTEAGDDPQSQTADLNAAAPPAATKTKLGARFFRTNLVSDQEGAANLDSTLVNPWGLTFSPNGIAWVSVNGSGLVNVYDAHGRTMAPGMTVPTPAGSAGPAKPTGQVFNNDPSTFNGDTFIVSTEDGTIAGWQGSLGRSFETRIDNSGRGAIYKAIALGTWQGKKRLFAADFHNRAIDVFDESYVQVSTGGNFATETPGGYAPFNIGVVNDALVVTWAQQDAMKQDDVKGMARGYVELYDADGHFLQKLASKGVLNAPWGIAVTPWTWGNMSNRLLISNFGDGTINAFRIDNSAGSATAISEGPLDDANGQPLKIDGLWAISFGPGAGGFDSRILYFTAGPMDEMHGVFGMVQMQSPFRAPAPISPAR
jgi:uncharacterized protein (TIGR03118 family)